MHHLPQATVRALGVGMTGAAASAVEHGERASVGETRFDSRVRSLGGGQSSVGASTTISGGSGSLNMGECRPRQNGR